MELEKVINEAKGLTALLNSVRISEDVGGAHVYNKEALMLLEAMSDNIVKQLEEIKGA